MTVRELAALLEVLDPESSVLVHLGWDLAIIDHDIDEDGLILFADDAEVAVVSRQWLEAYDNLKLNLTLGGGA